MTAALELRVIRYQCPYCNRSWSKRTPAETHIARCWRNPATRSCKTCVNFCPAEKPHRFDPGYQPEAEGCALSLLEVGAPLKSNCPAWSDDEDRFGEMAEAI